jgi:hypothetical protein
MNPQLRSLIRTLRAAGFSTTEPRGGEVCFLANASHLVAVDLGGPCACRVARVTLRLLPLAWVDCRSAIAQFDRLRLPFWDVLAGASEAEGLAALAKSSLTGSAAALFHQRTVSMWMKVYAFQATVGFPAPSQAILADRSDPDGFLQRTGTCDEVPPIARTLLPTGSERAVAG